MGVAGSESLSDSVSGSLSSSSLKLRESLLKELLNSCFFFADGITFLFLFANCSSIRRTLPTRMRRKDNEVAKLEPQQQQKKINAAVLNASIDISHNAWRSTVSGFRKEVHCDNDDGRRILFAFRCVPDPDQSSFPKPFCVA